MNGLIQMEMTLEEARETDRLIKRHINTTRYLLLDMRDRKGWKALGYKSFVEYGEKELGFQKSHIYELTSAAEIGLQLGFSDKSENQPKERHLYPLKAVPEDERKAIWDEATRKAQEDGEKLTVKRVEEEVARWKETVAYHKQIAESTQHELALERQRSAEWKDQWKAERDKPRPVQIPADYDVLKQAERDLRIELGELKQRQRELVQQQVIAKLKERESELAEIDKKAHDAKERLEGLRAQIDRYSMRERELKVHMEVIEKARTAIAGLAANMEGFDEVIDPDNELRRWRALADMMEQGAAAIRYFVGDAKPALTIITGGAA